MKRWKKITLIAGASLAGLVLVVLLMGPAIAGSIVRSKILAVLKESLGADATVGGVTVRWSGHITLDDFKIVNPGFAQPVVEVRRVDVRIALGAALGGRYLAQIEVIDPKIVVEKGANGRFNCGFERPSSKGAGREKEEGKPGKLPHVEAGLRIRGGEVTILGKGRATRYRNLTADAKVDTLEKPIDYSLSLEGPEKDAVRVQGSFDLEKRSGPATVRLERLDLKNLTGAARATSDLLELGGTVDGTLEYALQGVPHVAGKGRLEVTDFLLGMPGRTMRLDRLTITHDAALDERKAANHSLSLISGRALDARIAARVEDPLGTPVVEADLRLESDLGALIALLPPGLAELKPDTDLAGALTVTARAETKGTTWVRFDAGGTASNLASIERKTKKATEIEPAVAFKAAGTWDRAKKGVDLREFTLASSFATAEAGGGFVLTEPVSVRESSLRLKADLRKLGAKLALFMADPPSLEGNVDVRASYAGETYALDAAAAGLKAVTRTSAIGPLDLSVVQKGTLSFAPGGGLRIDACRIVSSALVAEGTGEIRRVRNEDREGEIRLDASVRPTELSKWIGDLNLGGPEIRLTASASMKPGLVSVKGGTKLDGLTRTVKDAATGKPVTQTVKTGPLEFEAVMKDREIVAGAKAAIFEWLDAGYSVKGGLVSDVTYHPDKGTTGTTRIANLEIADDRKNAMKDPDVTLVHDIAMTPAAFEIRKAELTSTFLRGTVRGRILDRDKPARRIEGLVLDFTYHPDRLNAVLGPWMEGMKLEGAEEKRLKVTLDGTMKTTDVLEILRGSTAGVDVDLAKFTAEGITVSGMTRLALRGGMLAVGTPLVVNRGTATLRATADFRPEGAGPGSELHLVAKDVRANARMKVLQALNPIFHVDEKGASTIDGRIDGTFDLAWTGKVDPGWAKGAWEEAAVGSLKGSGVFAVKDLKIVGSPTVTEIMTLLGEGNTIQGELVASAVDVGHRQVGWCRYDAMVLRLARYEVRFRGGVAFAATKHGSERAMDLEVEIPMTEHMVKTHPGLAKYLGKRFWIPLRGTVEHPVLDYKKLFLDLTKNAAEVLIQEKAEDLLKKLLDKKKKDK